MLHSQNGERAHALMNGDGAAEIPGEAACGLGPRLVFTAHPPHVGKGASEYDENPMKMGTELNLRALWSLQSEGAVQQQGIRQCTPSARQ